MLQLIPVRTITMPTNANTTTTYYRDYKVHTLLARSDRRLVYSPASLLFPIPLALSNGPSTRREKVADQGNVEHVADQDAETPLLKKCPLKFHDTVPQEEFKLYHV